VGRPAVVLPLQLPGGHGARAAGAAAAAAAEERLALRRVSARAAARLVVGLRGVGAAGRVGGAARAAGARAAAAAVGRAAALRVAGERRAAQSQEKDGDAEQAGPHIASIAEYGGASSRQWQMGQEPPQRKRASQRPRPTSTARAPRRPMTLPSELRRGSMDVL